MTESRSAASSGRTFSLDSAELKNFSEDHRELIGRAKQLRKELTDWRSAAAIRTNSYREEVEQLHDELLESMTQLEKEVQAMRSKVRAVLAIHDPSGTGKGRAPFRPLN